MAQFTKHAFISSCTCESSAYWSTPQSQYNRRTNPVGACNGHFLEKFKSTTHIYAFAFASVKYYFSVRVSVRVCGVRVCLCGLVHTCAKNKHTQTHTRAHTRTHTQYWKNKHTRTDSTQTEPMAQLHRHEELTKSTVNFVLISDNLK